MRKTSGIKTLILVSCAVLFFLSGQSAQAAEPFYNGYEKTNTMIQMRDGVKLNTDIYAPKNSSGPLPFMLLRTPYGIDGSGFMLGSYLKELAEEGYVFVFQDIRGRFKSEGQFVMLRQPRNSRDPNTIDESTDTNDTVEWLIKNVPNNNARVGVMGISYGGWLTVMAMLDPHPAIKAVSPQASPADMFLGDDFHHNGAFRLSYGFEYVAMMETGKTNSPFTFDRYDTYEWYLNLGALSNANAKYFHGKMPTWNDFVEHHSYDQFWQQQASAPYLNRVTVPTLNVAGWWDQEDFYGPLKTYELLEKHDSKKINYLIVGPWNHGGWAGGPGDKLGRIEFDSPTGAYFRERIQASFFNYYLKDKGKFDVSEAYTFQTGANKWQTYTEWPPRKNVSDRSLYFHSNGRLSFDQPTTNSDKEFDSYISDPANPVPYRPRPIDASFSPLGSGWPTWLVEDQRFADRRPDVFSWQTETLQEDVVITGEIIAHIFASTSGTDSDWIVKIIDVYPDDYQKNPKMGGYQLMVANDVFRGRFRKSFEKPEPIVADQVNEYVIETHGIDHRFLKGHKIMVQVQSTWFPIIDRNPQKYVENIFKSKDADYQKATQRIFRSKQFASHLKVPVVAN